MKKTPKSIGQSLVRSLSVKDGEKLNALIRESMEFLDLLKKTGAIKVLKGAFVKGAEKERLLGGILKNVSLTEGAEALMRVLIRMNQFADLPKVIDALKDIRSREMKFEEAELITAKALNESQKSRVAKKLEKLSGCRVAVNEKQNRAILGGLMVRMGDTVIDASLIRKIKELRKELTI